MDHIDVETHGDYLPYEIQLRSDIGGRREQQDSACVYADDTLLFAIVCDGMGGAEQGAQASKIAVHAGSTLLKRLAAGASQKDTVQFLEETMMDLDLQVSCALGKRRSGTTIVIALLKDGKLYWASAGDSRLYIFRDNELVQATRDHNYFLRLKEQLRQGDIDQETFSRESDRGEALISYLGIGGLPVYDLTTAPLPVAEGDILLLTTDGLYKAIPQGLICHILKGKGSLAEKADTLMKQITVLKESILLDNTTFVLIKIKTRGGADEPG